MEDLYNTLKAANMTLDQSQARQTVFTSKQTAHNALRGGRVFDNLGATPYISPTKAAAKGTRKVVKEDKATGLKGKEKSKARRSPSPLFTADSDDEMLLTGSSVHGSPCKAERVSVLTGGGGVGPKKLPNFTKRPGISSKAVPTSPPKISGSPVATGRKTVSSQISIKQPKGKETKAQGGTKGKVKSATNAAGKVRRNPTVKSPKGKVDPLDRLLKEKKGGVTLDESTPKPKPQQSVDLKGTHLLIHHTLTTLTYTSRERQSPGFTAIPIGFAVALT